MDQNNNFKIKLVKTSFQKTCEKNLIVLLKPNSIELM